VFSWINDSNEDTEMGLAVIKTIILIHLTTLVNQLEKYSPTDWDIAKHNWISQSFNINIRGNTTPFTDCPERVC
jgi:hypothetical protein